MKLKALIFFFLCTSASISWSQVSNGIVSNESSPANLVSVNFNNDPVVYPVKIASDLSLQVQAYCEDSLNLVRISWIGPAGFKIFDVYRNEALVASNIRLPYFVDSSVRPAAYYHYSIVAKNEKETFSSSISPNVFTSPCLAASTGINPFQITVSPNPSPSVFYFTASNLRNKILNIEVLNNAGTKVYQHQTKSMTSDFIQTIELDKVPSGIYFMKVQIDRNTYFKQLVKQ